MKRPAKKKPKKKPPTDRTCGALMEQAYLRQIKGLQETVRDLRAKLGDEAGYSTQIARLQGFIRDLEAQLGERTSDVARLNGLLDKVASVALYGRGIAAS